MPASSLMWLFWVHCTFYWQLLLYWVLPVWLWGRGAAQDGWGGWSQSLLLGGRQVTDVWAADSTKTCGVGKCGASERTVTCKVPNPTPCYQRGMTWPLSCPALHSLHACVGCRGSAGAVVWAPCSPAHCCDVRVWSIAEKTVNKISSFRFSVI